MVNNVPVEIESTSLTLLREINTKADMIFLHIEGVIDQVNFEEYLKNFHKNSNLKLIMTSGYMNEYFHDKFDDVILDESGYGDTILTIWSNDTFEESVEEFLQVHGSNPNISSAKILIISECIKNRMELTIKSAQIILRGHC